MPVQEQSNERAGDAGAMPAPASPPTGGESTAAPAAAPALPALLPAREVRRIFGRSDRTIRRWIESGVLVPVRLPGCRSLFFRSDDIARLLQVRLADAALARAGAAGAAVRKP
ncbi:MerR family transcriptional regulator (plasmid) [Rhodovastum atsumiense]|uniref:MerR family transcriptional regulator n=1 Tax=Rhodovastum atsumiense TaxID=504468 RepID=A0A5M6IL84_9PROT|nr:helix-turn-helix domain-containing protein [Rhodovastum atsumiense]KAA5608629.1 MerR family transcriptional regulator [Rhodovastum atsumiense]CAH2605980.1 MerR family transcriptional regulator [Rhodovastum atsumiense]